ncbi:MAG: hypothetical protein ABIO70_32240 [Pseudomonadota bacterium]
MRADLASVILALQQEQGLQERAVLALVQLPPRFLDEPAAVARMVSAAIEGPAEVLVVEESAAVLERLRELNTGRGLALRQFRALVFICRDGAAARLLRRTATDLTASLDLSFELDVRVEVAREALREGLLAAQRARFANLDLSGLVPHSAERVEIPLE